MGAYFTISSIIYIMIFMYFFFSKKKANNIETNIYKYLLITTLVGLIFDALGYFTFELGLDPNSFLYNCIAKTMLLYFVAWSFEFSYYIYAISYGKQDQKNDKLKNFKKTLIILFWLFVLLVVVVPVKFNVVLDVVVPDGITVGLTYVIFALAILVSSIFSFINMKKIISKKYTPLYLLLVMTVIMFIVQKAFPHLFLINFAIALVVIIMYFTIENPDIHMINELYKNKLLVEKSYEEKSNFLFKMTQEVKKPINNMKNILSNLKEVEDIISLKQGIKLLEANSKQMDFIVNDVLDITTLDSKNIKIMNNRYNVYNLFKDIEKRMQEYAKDEVEFRFNIDENIPYLYGDSIKLKQIIMSVLLNSIKKTNSGFIELSIESIVRYDVCRLIIEVEDSGVGMSIDKVNDILVTTSELSVDDINNLEKLDINLKLCQKSIKLLGGNLMIRSEEGKGTEVIITIDQKIYENNNNISELDKYEHILYNSSKILVVSDKEEDLNNIKKVINDDSVMISSSFYGKDAIDKIKSGKTYDLIIMEDELPNMSGLSTLKELKELDGFKSPVVVILDKNKEFIKDHYVNDGFQDYILREKINEEVKRIIDKYI